MTGNPEEIQSFEEKRVDPGNARLNIIISRRRVIKMVSNVKKLQKFKLIKKTSQSSKGLKMKKMD